MLSSTTMYPDWPESFDDLVPLPQCEGPKLKPFNFRGPQKIKFLDYVGSGLHSHVFKVEILGQIYALKLFRFCTDKDWMGPDLHSDRKDVQLMSTFANYSEPFNCECRAFGRLQETDNCGLAVQCFGYVLLDEVHEKAMLDQFMDNDQCMDNGYTFSESGDLKVDFKIDETNLAYMYYSLRSHFLGRNGRPPPIRGIVKEFVQMGDENLRKSTLLKVKRDVTALQQLGIIHLDVATRNLGEGKFVDFSTAYTTPHYIINPELNPRLTPEWISAMAFETFQFAIGDYMDVEEMVVEWNDEQEDQENGKNKVSFNIFPQRRYKLRNSDERLYSLVNPRLHDWRTFSTGSRSHQSGATNGRSPRSAKILGSISRPYRRLYTKPPRWYFDFDGHHAARRQRKHTDFRQISTTLEWVFKDGLLFPHRKE